MPLLCSAAFVAWKSRFKVFRWGFEYCNTEKGTCICPARLETRIKESSASQSLAGRPRHTELMWHRCTICSRASPRTKDWVLAGWWAAGPERWWTTPGKGEDWGNSEWCLSWTPHRQSKLVREEHLGHRAGRCRLSCNYCGEAEICRITIERL